MKSSCLPYFLQFLIALHHLNPASQTELPDGLSSDCGYSLRIAPTGKTDWYECYKTCIQKSRSMYYDEDARRINMYANDVKETVAPKLAVDKFSVWVDLSKPEVQGTDWFSSTRPDSPLDQSLWDKNSFFESTKTYRCGLMNYKKGTDGSYEVIDIKSVDCFKENHCVCMSCRK